MALREVINPRIDGGDLDGGAGTRAPDSGVDGTRLGGRGVMLQGHLA